MEGRCHCRNGSSCAWSSLRTVDEGCLAARQIMVGAGVRATYLTAKCSLQRGATGVLGGRAEARMAPLPCWCTCGVATAAIWLIDENWPGR